MSPEERVKWERKRRLGYAAYVIAGSLLGGIFASYVPGLIAIGIVGHERGWSDFIAVNAIKSVLFFIVFWFIRHYRWNSKEAEYLAASRDTQTSPH